MSLPGQPGEFLCGIVSDSPDSIRDTSSKQGIDSGKPTQLLFKNFTITSDGHHHICDKCLALKEEAALTSMLNLEKDGNVTELVNAKARAVIKSSKDKDCEEERKVWPIHMAAYRGHAKLLQWLLERRAEVDQQIAHPTSKNDDTALHTAVWYNRESAVEVLLKHKASASIEQKEGFTALHHAARFGRQRLVCAILKSLTEESTSDLRKKLEKKIDRHPIRLCLESKSMESFKAVLEHPVTPSPSSKAFKKLKDNLWKGDKGGGWKFCPKTVNYIFLNLHRDDKVLALFEEYEVDALNTVIRQCGSQWSEALNSLVCQPETLLDVHAGAISRHQLEGDVDHVHSTMKQFWFQNFVNRWKGWAYLAADVQAVPFSRMVIYCKDGKKDYTDNKKPLIDKLKGHVDFAEALGITEVVPAQVHVIPVEVHHLTDIKVIRALSDTKNEASLATNAAAMILEVAWGEVQGSYCIHLLLALCHVVLIVVSTPSWGYSHEAFILLQALLVGKKIVEEACQFLAVVYSTCAACEPGPFGFIGFWQHLLSSELFEYLLSIRTVTDWASLGLSVAGVLRLQYFDGHPLSRTLVGIYYLMVWYAGLYAMRGMSLWRFNERFLPILQAMRKTGTFFFVLGVSLLAASHAYFTVGRMERIPDNPMYRAFERTFRLGFLGDFDLDQLMLEDTIYKQENDALTPQDPTLKHEHVPVHLFFYFAALVLTIVEMNLFIGILSNNFDIYIQKARGLTAKEKAHLVLHFRNLPWTWLWDLAARHYNDENREEKWIFAAINCRGDAPKSQESEGPKLQVPVASTAPEEAPSSPQQPFDKANRAFSETGNDELSQYFQHNYSKGKIFCGTKYKRMNVGDVPAFRFDAPDGAIWVWSLAVDLRPTITDNFIVLFHYTNILGFIDVTGSGQALLVSMENKGGHFGQGIYGTKQEPAQWGSRRFILQNNYTNGDPFKEGPGDPALKMWDDNNPEGNRAAFCIPIIVSQEFAYSIHNFDEGYDHKGRKVHQKRDIFVIPTGQLPKRLVGVEQILRNRIALFQRERGGSDPETLEAIGELADRLRVQGAQEKQEAKGMYRELVEGCRVTHGDKHAKTHQAMRKLFNLLDPDGDGEEREKLAQVAFGPSESLSPRSLREPLSPRSPREPPIRPPLLS